VLKQAAAEGVTFFPGVPTVFAMLGEIDDVSRWDLSRVRAVTSTGAVLSQRHIATIRRIFPSARIFSMYGVTECKRCTYLPPDALDRKPGSVGIAMPDTELWLVDDQDRRLGPNQVGQIVIRGPTVMRGYWEDPVETSRMLRPGPTPGERVLYTGDLGRLDEDGYLYFVGRMDDIIKSRGEKVAPKEVELVLAAIPGVKEVAVIGIADDLLGQAVKAFVALDKGATLAEGDVLRACRDKLEGFMVPGSIVFLPSLPKSANGKIDKLSLGEAANTGHAGAGTTTFR
jgi:acyl-CoA synthetase (AMP-forming)/AMP-acid ligase II